MQGVATWNKILDANISGYKSTWVDVRRAPGGGAVLILNLAMSEEEATEIYDRIFQTNPNRHE